ncbi:MAG: tetratricopeptide repeat protein [Planctomycetota bacterium]|nr:tetratricopeptide repeat protein [Planctomycetota bacterium]
MKITTLLLVLGSLSGCSAPDTIEVRAAHGDLEAQATLGGLYANGDGVPEDDVEAVRLFRMAAEGGLPRAQFYLACMYGGGKGVPKDHEAAANWYRKAADQGMPEAQFYLACLYEEGTGVPKDLGEARRWMSLAAEQGLVEAVEYMPGIGRLITPEELEASRRFGELLEATELQQGN